MKEYPKRWNKALRLLAAAGAIALMGAGCGRTLPVIDEETLALKKSMLVLVGESVSEEEAGVIRETAEGKAASEHISMEFVAKTSTNSEFLSSTISMGTYDGVIAAGDELLAPLTELAVSVPEQRFVMLGNGFSTASLQPDSMPDNVYLKLPDDLKKAELWNEWVGLQQAAGLNIFWISRTGSPVPEEWAPSEEADQVLQLDIFPGDTWFSQLSHQLSAFNADIIALYTPVDEDIMAKILSLKLPVTDMTEELRLELKWAPIVEDSVSRALFLDWKGGMDYYSAAEASLSRK